jgi:dUTP pyrophosphatase
MATNVKEKPKKKTAGRKSPARSSKAGTASQCTCPVVVPTPIVADPPQIYNNQQITFTPQYQTEGSACCDLIANCPPDVNGQKKAVLPPRATVMIDCGFSMAIPPGFKACISARSGHAKAGLLIPNAPGQIDQDYRGRVVVLLTNVSRQLMIVEHGERFAQMWLEPVYRFGWVPAETLPETQRGTGGFGSTGK